MKKLLFVACAALALAGCNRDNTGGTSDQYDTGTGGSSSMSNAPSSRDTDLGTTNRSMTPGTSGSQGGSSTPGSSTPGSSSSDTSGSGTTSGGSSSGSSDPNAPK